MNRRQFLSSVSAAALLAAALLILVVSVSNHDRIKRLVDRIEANSRQIDATAGMLSAIEKRVLTLPNPPPALSASALGL